MTAAGAGGSSSGGSSTTAADQVVQHLVKTKSVLEWTIDDVCLWCKLEAGVTIAERGLRQHYVTGTMLIQLDFEMLSELGIPSQVAQLKHVTLIKRLYESQGLKLRGIAPSGLRLFSKMN